MSELRLFGLSVVILCAVLASLVLTEPSIEQVAAVGAIGDVNCDGSVTAIDAALVLQRDAGLITSLPCPQKADANGDGLTSAVDAALILQFDAGLIHSLGPPPATTPTRTRTPTPAATRTRTPSPTQRPTSTPLATPSTECTVTFASFYNEPDEFCGVVTEMRPLTSIPGSLFYDPVTAPLGSQYVVVFMTVTNFASGPHHVGIFSFRLRDSLARLFTFDFPGEFIVQLTAEAHFALNGLYDTLQPGLTDNMVFVFLTPADATGLTAERCPTNGCQEGAPPSPGPPSGCPLVFASFYSEPDEFCGTVTEIRPMTTIPGNLFYDPVTAPPGSQFAVVFMTVTNFASAPDDVGIFSFRLRDTLGRIFTVDFPDEFIVQLTAEAHFALNGLYDTLQPGLTANMVFVFLTPADATGLTAERCPANGCTP